MVTLVYDTFGNLTTNAAEASPFTCPPLNPEGDPLRAAAARCYDPNTGHWLEQDSGGSDANLYRFVACEVRSVSLNEDGTVTEA